MGKSLRKFISLFVILLMIAPLARPVFADDAEPDDSDTAVVQNEAAEAPAAVVQGEPEAAETPAVAEPAEPEAAEALAAFEPAEPEAAEAPAAAEQAEPEEAKAPAAAEPAESEAAEAPAATEPDESVEESTSAATEADVSTERVRPAVRKAVSAPAAAEQAEPEEAEAPAAAEQAEPEEAKAPAAAEPAESEAAEAPAATEPDESVEESTSAATEADVSTERVRPAVRKAVSAPAAAEEGSESNAEKNITIAGTSLDCSKDGSGSGWTYEKDSGRIVLRDYLGSADITSDGTGIDIVSTGFNRIGTLSCDGDINVIGTGILLIDKVELAEDCSFNLLPLKEYYGDEGGSVAVFLRQENGSYMMINGDKVKGIIDEKLELPSNIKLVLPADSTLELQAVIFHMEKDEYDNENLKSCDPNDINVDMYNPDNEVYGGHLYVGDLTLNKGATIKNNSWGEAIVASINVAGNLINDGLITGGAVNLGGKYSDEGSGTVDNAFITFTASQTTSINIKDSTLNFKQGNYTIKQLGLSGKSELYYSGNFELKTIMGDTGSSLDIYSFNIEDNIKLTEAIDRTAVLVKSGITELGTKLEFLNGGTINNRSEEKNGDKIIIKNYGGPVFNYSKLETDSDGTEGSVFLRPKKITVPSDQSIPVVSLNLHKDVGYDFNITLVENKDEGQKYTKLKNYAAKIHYYYATTTPNDPNAERYRKGTIAYNDLFDTYFPEEPELEDGQSIIFEVFCYKDKKLSMTVLDENGEEMDSEGAFLIRLVYLDPWTNQHGGTPASSTRASQTGSGNIGGNKTSILTGTGITRFSSVDPVEPDPDPIKPDDPDPEKPDPDPIKPDDPDPVKPDPDPIKPDDPDPVKPDDPDPVKPDDPDPIKPDDPDPVKPDDPDPIKPDDSDPVKPDDPDPIKPDDPDPIKPDDPDPVKPDDPDPDKPVKEYSVAALSSAGDALVLQINEFDLNEDGSENAEKIPYYNLTAYINGAQVNELDIPVKVEMDYVLPEEFKDKALYAVFENKDETSEEMLKAFKAEYDEESGKLIFETTQTGEFMIAALEFDGEEFSPEFYDELEKTEPVKLFIRHLKEKKDDAEL